MTRKKLNPVWTKSAQCHFMKLALTPVFEQMVNYLETIEQVALPEVETRPDIKKEPEPVPEPRRHSHTTYYSVAKIAASLQATKDETGRYPLAESGLILHGPLANGTRTWMSVDKAIRSLWRPENAVPICNSLTRSNCPYKSLTDLKQAFGMDDLRYTFRDIMKSYRMTYERTGAYPGQKAGLIAYGPLNDGKRQWGSVDKAMNHLWKEGNEAVVYSGLTRATCPCRSLAELRRLVSQSSPVPDTYPAPE